MPFVCSDHGETLHAVGSCTPSEPQSVGDGVVGQTGEGSSRKINGRSDPPFWGGLITSVPIPPTWRFGQEWYWAAFRSSADSSRNSHSHSERFNACKPASPSVIQSAIRSARCGGLIPFWVCTAADNSLKDALRDPVHSSGAFRDAPLASLKSQDSRLVFNQKSDRAEAHIQQIAELVNRVLLFDCCCNFNHCVHQASSWNHSGQPGV